MLDAATRAVDVASPQAHATDTSNLDETQSAAAAINTTGSPNELDGLPHVNGSANGLDRTPTPSSVAAKKRKFDQVSRSQSAPRPISPPWKTFAADGPTVFTENGKRRSGRVNHGSAETPKPVAPEPTKFELTPVADTHDTTVTPVAIKTSSRGSTQVSSQSLARKRESLLTTKLTPKLKQEDRHAREVTSKSPIKDENDIKPVEKRRPGRPPKSSKAGLPAKADTTSRQPRSSTRQKQLDDQSTAERPNTRLKLPRRLIHPSHPLHIPQPSPYPSMTDILTTYDQLEKERACAESVDHLGNKIPARPLPNFDQLAIDEAQSRVRLLDASQPGGPLSQDQCSIFLPDPQADPPKRYSHADHFLTQLTFFRTLMKRERARHMDMAKKVAHACLAKWQETRPQTAEDKLLQDHGFNKLIYQQIVRDVQRKWDLVTAETQKRRLEKWVQDQEVTRDLKMQKLLDDTTKMLDQRRLAIDTDVPMANDDDDGDTSSRSSGSSRPSNASSQDSDDSEDDDVMSSSDSSEDSAEDEIIDADDNLSPEALRQKYAALPTPLQSDQADVAADTKLADLYTDNKDAEYDDTGDVEMTDGAPKSPQDSSEEQVVLEDVDDALLDTDEDASTDMSDDMGSSDEEDEFDEVEESANEEDHDPGPGLLGFLDTTERRRVEETRDDDAEPQVNDQMTGIADTSDHVAQPETAVDIDDNAMDVTSPIAEDDAAPTPVDKPIAQNPTITTRVPSLLRGTLREYQHFGLDWLAKLYVNQTNGILADEMGLGKTIQTIALLAHLAEEHHVWGPHLIVVPTSVILNWEMEFKKFLPGFRVLSYYGSQEERAAKRKGWSNPDKVNVVITSYQLILKDLSSIRVPEWHYMILDEAHNIKNFQSQRYQAMIRLKTHARLLLTGTPLQNSIQELWSLLTFLTAGQDGQGMGDLDEFTQWFKRPVDEIFVDGKNKLGVEAQEIVNKLHYSLRPYILRRMKSQVEKQLPGKYEHTVFCRLSKRQRQLYDAFLGRADVKEKLTSGNPISVSQALMALRKVCNHPDLFEERPIVTSFTMRKPASTMPRAVAADFEIMDLLVRKRLISEADKDKAYVFEQLFNLCGAEHMTRKHFRHAQRSQSSYVMAKEVQRARQELASKSTPLDTGSLANCMAYNNMRSDTERIDRLARYAALTARRVGQMPLYGYDLVERCTVTTRDRIRLPKRMLKSQDQRRHILGFDEMQYLPSMVQSRDHRAASLQTAIEKFAFVTPNAVAHDVLPYTLSPVAIDACRERFSSDQPDCFHEARVRLSIAFPDRRLLQYDCGKLQQLALLLRRLQTQGSHALIFTQMTSVLNILEMFLNIHGYRYLRLDGSTRIEQRQEMMERFNKDTRIDVFILSSRSGGVGMNLTGADSVIFYDLDWNPQMDKQCQDRAHRIGQTRDVHIYKLVSEHTIEVNILKKSNQKRMLDEVVIQEGDFTTDNFNRPSAEIGTLQEDSYEADDAAGAAVDRVLGLDGQKSQVNKVLAAAEDAVDAQAAAACQKEAYVDDADFEPTSARPGKSSVNSGVVTPALGDVADRKTVGIDEVGAVDAIEDGLEVQVPHVDEYMLRFAEHVLRDQPFVPPVDKKGRLDKNGRDRSHRPRKR